VQLPEGLDRDALQARLKDQDVPTMVYYPKPMHGQKAFEGAHLCSDGCPVTKRLCETALSLPMGPCLKRADSEAVSSTLKGTFS